MLTELICHPCPVSSFLSRCITTETLFVLLPTAAPSSWRAIPALLSRSRLTIVCRFWFANLGVDDDVSFI
jgi:hypothetical protein